MERASEHLLQSIERLRVPARLTLEVVTRYYMGQLAPEYFRAAPEELAAALAEIRRALSCRALVSEKLSADDQDQMLEVLGPRLPTPRLDEEPESKTDHIDALLQEVSIGLICWHARTSTSFALFGEGRDRLPDCERFRHGDFVIVRAADWSSSPYNGCTGTFLRYSDPRIRHPDRWAVVDLGGQDQGDVVCVRPAHLEFAREEEELELGSYRPLKEYQIESETWSERQDAGRYRCALVLKYRLTEHSPWHRVTLSAGRGDDFDVFTDGIAVYVLSVNDLLPCVGVQVFVDDQELEHFFYQEWQVDWLGADFWNLAPVARLKQVVEGYQPREVDESERELIGTWSRHGFTLRLYDTGRVDRLGKSILAYELHDQQFGQVPIFRGGGFHCSPLQDRASDGAAADVLGFLSQRPEDSDSERFGSYTTRQRRWCAERASDLALVAEQLEQRQRWRELHEAGETEEAVLAVARGGRVEDLFEVLDMDIFEAYDLVAELCRRRDDGILDFLLGELHYWRNVELVGGEDELARLYE